MYHRNDWAEDGGTLEQPSETWSSKHPELYVLAPISFVLLVAQWIMYARNARGATDDNHMKAEGGIVCEKGKKV